MIKVLFICHGIKSSDYSVDKDDVTEFFVGHKNIVYNGSVSEIVVVSVRGTNGTNAEWSSNFDVGADTTDYYDAVGYDLILIGEIKRITKDLMLQQTVYMIKYWKQFFIIRLKGGVYLYVKHCSQT